MDGTGNSRRLVVVLVLALALLAALLFATGGGFPQASVATPTPQAAAPAGAPTASGQQVQGTISVAVQALPRSVRRYVYTVHDTGKTPLAGFQISGAQANLFNVSGRAGWHVFGTGVCGGGPNGLLVYWSTRAGTAAEIRPGASARFAFSVATSGSTAGGYALSYGSAQPLFGNTQIPAPSRLPRKGPCGG